MSRAARFLAAAAACAAALVASGALAASPRPADRVLRAEIVVPAPVSEVWAAWTTDDGIASFFAPEGHVDLKVDGTYDVWFNPKGGPEERGAEGMRILDIEQDRRFAFTWNAPPSIASVRGRRTVVVLEFEPAGERATRLRFTHLGWGDGPDWDKAYDYFDRAWGAIVLPRLVRRFEHGKALDWDEPVVPLAKWPTLKHTLAEAG